MCGQRVADVADDPIVGFDQPEVHSVTPIVASIVVIADESVWRQRTAAFLANEGLAVVVDPLGDAAFDARARDADAAVIDLRLSARPATEVCAVWRTQSTAPILALANTRDEATVLDAFAAGADHVASIDVTDRQLLARLRSVLRRAPSRRGTRTEAVVAPSPILLDVDRRVALVQGTKVFVTQQEFEFLELLIKRAGRVVSRSELSASLRSVSSSDRAVDFFVRRLREKLESVDGQRRIIVVRGVGFRFEGGTVAGIEAPT